MDQRAEERAFAARVVSREAEALERLAESLGARFGEAVDVLDRCARQGGTILVSGLGKSGLIGAKISATLASLGIPSHAVHPSEAAHGDLGRFRPTDGVICLSFSGETEEVVNLAAILRQDGLPIVAITGGQAGDRSTLERLASVTLHLGLTEEAGAPDFLAPTSSTTATMALGDALALALARRRNVTSDDFARRHPGGSLGGQLRPVTEILRFRVGENLAVVDESSTVAEALRRAAEPGARRPGAMLLIDAETGQLTGIFTDGDLRRLILHDPRRLDRPVREAMTPSPRTLPHDARVRDAVLMVREHRQDEIPVVDRERRPVGILDVQDLVTMRLVSD